MKVQNYKLFFFTAEIMVESLFLLHLATNLLKRSWCHCRIRNLPETDLLKVKWLPHLEKLPSHCRNFWSRKLIIFHVLSNWSHSGEYLTAK